MKHFLSSTKNKFIIFLLIPLTLAIFLVYGILQKEGAQLIMQQKSNLLSLLVQNISHQFDTLMQNRAKEVQFIASSYELQSQTIPLEKKKALFERMKHSHKHYAWIGMTDQDGNIIVGTDNLLVGIEAAKKKGVQFGRRAILSFKDKKVIFKQYEKGKSVAWLSKFFHVARNTIYRALKDVAKKK